MNTPNGKNSLNRLPALLSGPVFFIFLTTVNPFSLDLDAARVLAIASWMIAWWITEATPMAVTSLLPILLFPAMGIMKLDEASGPYGNPVVFLFLGGFMIGLAIEKWNLHRRIALSIVKRTGSSANRIILGFMLATHILSMWLSNTATAMMMLPIASSVIVLVQEQYKGNGSIKNFALSLTLGIAYSASIGGISTIIGTPPNVVLSGFLNERFQYELSFFEWMLFATPLAFILLIFCYIILVWILFPNKIGKNAASTDIIRQELKKLGPISTSEKRVLAIFITTALLWILKSPINILLHDSLQSIVRLDDTGIALLGATLLFIVPSGNVNTKSILEWKDASKIAWGILLLFGGGLSLANALEKTGIIQMIGEYMASLGSGNALVLMACLSISALFLTEVMSNVALVTIYVPVVSGIAITLGIDPLYFAIPVTIAASCAFMLPMATPPNAIVFATGHIKISQMVKAGLILNLVSAILIILFTYLGLEIIFTGL